MRRHYLIQFVVSTDNKRFDLYFTGYEYKGITVKRDIQSFLTQIYANKPCISLNTKSLEYNSVLYAISKAIVQGIHETTPNHLETFTSVSVSHTTPNNHKLLARARLGNFVFDDLQETINAEMTVDIFDAKYNKDEIEHIKDMNILQTYTVNLTNLVKLVQPDYIQFKNEKKYNYTIFYDANSATNVRLTGFHISSNEERFNQKMYDFLEGKNDISRSEQQIDTKEVHDSVDAYINENTPPFVHEYQKIGGGISVEYTDVDKFNIFLETASTSGWTCYFSGFCTETNGVFVCEDVEIGNLEGLITNTSITITSEPLGACGMNGSMLGKYTYRE